MSPHNETYPLHSVGFAPAVRVGATEVHRAAVARREQGPFAATGRLAAEVQQIQQWHNEKPRSQK